MSAQAEPRFDFEALFDADYLYFYAPMLEQSAPGDTETIIKLLDLRPPMDVLDVPCGHGRISNRLAELGYKVVALDASELFLAQARDEAARKEVKLEYVRGDMRSMPWTAAFDALVNWFTSFGYFNDEENRAVLRQFYRVLRPGGRLLIEQMHRDFFLRILRAGRSDYVMERGEDLIIDRGSFDPLTGRSNTERIIVRDGKQRRAQFSVRMLTFPELRDWLLEAGFHKVSGFGPEGGPLLVDSMRMIVTAEK